MVTCFSRDIIGFDKLKQKMTAPQKGPVEWSEDNCSIKVPVKNHFTSKNYSYPSAFYQVRGPLMIYSIQLTDMDKKRHSNKKKKKTKSHD